GLADRFDGVEILSEKDEATYRRIMKEHRVDPNRFFMVGNSLRSDVLPVVALGGHAAHLPYHVTWAHEDVVPGEDMVGRFHVIESITDVPRLVHRLDGQGE